MLIVSASVIGLLQLDITQGYLLDRVKDRISQDYKTQITIGDVQGFLPFNIELREVVIANGDSSRTDTLAKIDGVTSHIDIWGFLQNKVTITGFTLENPEIWVRRSADGRIVFLERKEARQDTSSSERRWLNNVEILAPQIEIIEGTAHLESLTEDGDLVHLPSRVTLSNLNTQFFLEWTGNQRYLDIDQFSATTEDLNAKKFSITGQVYSDRQFLEFNSFFMNIGQAEVIINGEIEGLDLGSPGIREQFLSSNYDLGVMATSLYPRELREFLPVIPDIEGPFALQLYTEGNTESLWVEEVSIEKGESFFRLNGEFQNLTESNLFTYEASIDSLNLRSEDLAPILDTLRRPEYRALEDLSMRGSASGTLDSIYVDVAMSSPIGSMDLQGGSQLKSPYRYEGALDGQNIDISWMVPTVFDTTSINMTAQLSGSGITLEESATDFEASFTQSLFDQQTIDQVELSSSLYGGLWSQKFQYQNGGQVITGSGEIDFSRERPPVTMKGEARNINLTDFARDSVIASTDLDFTYSIEAAGLSLDEIRGQANFDVAPSVIGGDSVEAHQFYADISNIGEQRRSFRLTSSLLDMNVEGQLYPKVIMNQFRFWSAYLKERYRKEISMNDGEVQRAISAPEESVIIDGNITLKNLNLIKKYIPVFPSIHTDSRIAFNMNADADRLLFSTEMQADTLSFNSWASQNSQIQFTGSFRSDRTLKEFSSVDFRADIGTYTSNTFNMDSLGIVATLEQDSLYYRQAIKNIGENARFNLELNGALSDSSALVYINDFFLGNESYAWRNQDVPTLEVEGTHRIQFNDFRFANQNEYLQLQGAWSQSSEDSLSYTLRDINLERISELVDGEVSFKGVLNGELMTKSITEQPTVQGSFNISRLALNNRTVGDLQFNSQYNADADRFDTRIEVFTDPQKYEDYLEANDGIQQHFVLDGYIGGGSGQGNEDDLYHFDADFKQIDIWLVPLIVDNLFQQMEGQAVGQGYISGDLEDFDFHGEFDVQNAFIKPRFLNTNYFVNGGVTVDRQDGVILDSLEVIDTKGGSGKVWGTIDLNDFNPLTYLDLTFTMDRLQFLNSTMDPDVPFFGNISGTGTLRLSGSNADLYLRTNNPIQVTSDSKVSIPLLEETELTETGRFIQFVDSFEERFDSPTAAGEEGTSREEEIRNSLEDMTFSERFDLDLQFNTAQDIAVNLIFDPVTGEELNARGSGQMRISMQNQEVQMFGRYQINSGSYQFVTGEIISRRLQLRPGGTIVWEGPPDNARLDISAVYRARPNISTLSAEGSVGSQNRSNSQQVPVDLIVDITGTLNSVENSYYFELPSSLDISSNSTLSYTINQINRDEQQKLLQATSILFTGQFIPTQGAGSATTSLSQNLTRGSTVLNPLLSNQVISPLLSNQINALLNSDVSRLDVDFNLNAYNEVDLGIALSLYNDRLILRREGQLTGGNAQTTLGDRIGDLNATYRINRRLSLTAFHRQNQILSNFGAQSQAGDVTPSVDGIGLEAMFQFNTWQELFDRITGTSDTSSARKEEEASVSDTDTE
ncbi:translocation/assembly module TamB [Aliifodinibius salicampi]|uniref:Translocation/assembly module TamB n=1 Tax=Fodinibius salicampi TaxID=1920655 RepID=A0ABT3PUM3_9BACT|nr:hypothetical protein [Fodinibius salicampi]MCW9711543.1 translocation/assembly module TamB [Fodinibius salicampi]